MSTIVTNPNNEKEYEITKNHVVLVCELGCKHKFIKRIATALAEEICTCAEAHELEGDLSKRIDKLLLAKGEPKLPPKEKAWANSFCQDLENLESFSSKRLPQLLAEDYTNRFQKQNKSNNTAKVKKTNPSKNTQEKKGNVVNKKEKGKIHKTKKTVEE